MSALADVEAAIVSALQTAPAVAPFIQRGRSRPLPQEATSGAFVSLVGSEVEPLQILDGPLDLTTRVVVECQARMTSAQAPSAAVDALLVAANGRIAADPTLGGKAMDCRLTGLEYQADDADSAVCAAVTTWEVRHRASRTTLSTT